MNNEHDNIYFLEESKLKPLEEEDDLEDFVVGPMQMIAGVLVVTALALLAFSVWLAFR